MTGAQARDRMQRTTDAATLPNKMNRITQVVDDEKTELYCLMLVKWGVDGWGGETGMRSFFKVGSRMLEKPEDDQREQHLIKGH